MRTFIAVMLAAFVVTVAAPVAQASVHQSSDAGFVIRLAADVPASVEETWQAMVMPSQWWSAGHTYTGDPGNLALDARAGGCFCEEFPDPSSRMAPPRGSIEHMRVIYVENGRVLRLSGGLGPLQSEAVQGTLTMVIKPIDSGTRIMWEYVVGGYMRTAPAEMAPLVDKVLGEQLANLAVKLGGQPAARPVTPAQRQGPSDAPVGR